MAKIELELEDIQKLLSAMITSDKQSTNPLIGKYVIVRTYSAGVFAGELERKSGQEVTLKNVRRLWKWEGAASLSQLAMEGTKSPNECKFPCEVDKIELLQAIEILEVTDMAKKSIKQVKIWEI